MQNKSNNKIEFEDDSNLRDIEPNVITRSKPDSYYLAEINKISCEDTDNLVQDDTNKNISYCYNNKGNKKLVQWKKVEDLWISRNIKNSSEYREVNGNVCKIVTESCDARNPSQGCMLKCILSDKTFKTYSANYMAFP
jgi:hypothetical protein